MKKIGIIILTLILINNVYAYDVLIQTSEIDELEVLSIHPITNNFFYSTYYDEFSEETKYLFKFVNDNDVLEIKPNNKIYTIIESDVLTEFETFQIVKEGEVLSEHNLNFCNNNGKCEPCQGSYCVHQENEISCSDCKQSGKDNYCNILDDEICDLDCTPYEYEEENEYETCYEELLFRDSCSDYLGKTCQEDQICNGTQIILEGNNELCCLGKCEQSQDIDIFSKSCSDFFWEECGTNEVCEGNEIFLQHADQTCCTTQCIEGGIDDPNLNLEPIKKDYTSMVITLFLIFMILVLIWIIIDKKIIKITFLIFLFATGAIFFLSSKSDNQITANVVSQQEQAKMICDAAEAYNIPDSYLLAIAYKESRVNHFDKNGNAKIAGDCGVGITQQQFTPIANCDQLRNGKVNFICGTSKIDGRQLDATKLRDNIECGAIELINKCNYLSCIGNQKQYYCANSEINIPPKNVMYNDWDIAIRAYNGWGCGSNYYRNSMGVNSPEYLDLSFRIQSYVENFREVEKQFQGYCDGVDPSEYNQLEQPSIEHKRPSAAKEIDIPEELLEGEQIGYYYLNPSTKIKTNIDLSSISKELAYGNDLVTYVSNCKESGSSYSTCVQNKLNADSKTGTWTLLNIDTSGVGSFSLNTGFTYTDDLLQEKPFIIKFGLNLNKARARQISSFEYDEEVGDAPEIIKTKESEENEESQEEITPSEELETCSTDPITVVLFGDSITQGHYDYGNYLQDYFNENFNQEVNVKIITGLGGLRVDNEKSKEEFNNQILPLKPDFVLMWFGMNSLEDNPNIHQITYQEMIEEMLSKEITPILLTTSPTCSAFTSRDFSYLQNIVQIDKNLANHYDGVYLIDVREELNKVIGSNCANYFSDGYHINPEGHNQFANIVVNQFTEWKNNNEGPFSCQ